MQHLVELHENKLVTTTLKLAEIFGKEHFNVLKNLKIMMGTLKMDRHLFQMEAMSMPETELSAEIPTETQSGNRDRTDLAPISIQGNELSTETSTSKADTFFSNNFKEMTYLDDYGREQVAYEMTKSGFALLAMGFTGPEALMFKLDYINAFDAMEAKIIAMTQEKMKALEQANEDLDGTVSMINTKYLKQNTAVAWSVETHKAQKESEQSAKKAAVAQEQAAAAIAVTAAMAELLDSALTGYISEKKAQATLESLCAANKYLADYFKGNPRSVNDLGFTAVDEDTFRRLAEIMGAGESPAKAKANKRR